MIALGQEMSAAYSEQFLGSEQDILIEKVVPGAYVEGFTPHYQRARISLEGKGRPRRGKLIKARLDRTEEGILWGVPI